MGVNHAGKKKTDRDIMLKISNAILGVKEALNDLLGTMFIIYQPKDWYGEYGAFVTLTFKAMNVASYQWQHKDEGGSWTNSSATGYNTDTLTFAMVPQYGSLVRRCKLTDSDGNIIYTDIVHTYITEGS